ncbi:nuclear protein [Cryptococcus gattii Ru294]|nr:nuclear protein [Cryptococcus gattii Ru294]
MSEEAGPSQIPEDPQRRKTYSLRDEFHEATQTQKRHKVTDVSEIFQRPDAEEQKRLNKEYRALQSKADELKANLANATARDLAQALQKQALLFQNVKDTGIGTLDANLLRTNTENAMGLAKRFKIDGVTFDVDEFLIKMKGHLGLDRVELMDAEVNSDEEEEGAERQGRRGALGDWEKIGWMAARYYRRIPGAEFLYGPLQAEPKVRKVAQRRAKADIPLETRPIEVQNETASAKSRDEFTANVKTVMKTLARLDPDGEGVNFFRLVVNPDDFGQTVENCFYLSFLINQGQAGIYVKKDGEVMARSTIHEEIGEGGDQAKNQAVLEMDMETWEIAKGTFEITHSEIPHRDYAEIRIQSNSWYS